MAGSFGQGYRLDGGYQPGGGYGGGGLIGGGAGLAAASAGGPWGLAAYGGMQLAGGLLGWLGGRGRRKRAQQRYEGDRAGLMGLLGREAFRPQDIAFSARTQAMQGVGRQAELVNRRLGLDTGAAQTDILRGVAERNQGLLANLTMQNRQLTFNRDFDIRRSLLGMSAGRVGQVG